MDGTRTRATFIAGLVTLAVLVVLILTLRIPLIAMLGIAVVVFGMFLPPALTAVLAVSGIAAAVLVAATVEFPQEEIRLINATVASIAGVAVSWSIGQRVRRLSAMQRTQDAVFTHVPDGLAVLDPEGNVVQANAGLSVLVPSAQVGQPLHALLGHVLADGSPCPGGCRLDAGGDPAPTPVEGEWITRVDRRVAIEYTTARLDEGRSILSLRDVTALQEAEQDRRLLLEGAVRQGEQEALLKMMGAPAYAELPDVPGLEFDLYSTHTPSEWAGGGDLVHVVRMPDGRILVSVVDALGQGVISVRDAWKVHYVMQSYLLAGTPLPDVVPRTAAALTSEREVPNASVMLAVVDPDNGMVELVGGGHPPALLVRDNGATEWLEGAGPGIGFGAGGPEAVHSRQLLPGDSLVFYTDGLIDGTDDVIEALGTLRASAAALRKRETPGWSGTLAAALLAPGQASGSATVLLVRVAGGSGSRQTTATR